MSKAKDKYYKLITDPNFLQSLHQKEDMCDICEEITHNYVKELEWLLDKKQKKCSRLEI